MLVGWWTLREAKAAAARGSCALAKVYVDGLCGECGGCDGRSGWTMRAAAAAAVAASFDQLPEARAHSHQHFLCDIIVLRLLGNWLGARRDKWRQRGFRIKVVERAWLCVRAEEEEVRC